MRVVYERAYEYCVSVRMRLTTERMMIRWGDSMWVSIGSTVVKRPTCRCVR
jgi:hypothetical protein